MKQTIPVALSIKNHRINFKILAMAKVHPKRKKMKIFKQIQQNWLIYGVGLHQHPFNTRNLIAIVLFTTALLLSGVYSCCEAESFAEYTNSFFIATVLTASTINFTYVVCKVQVIFEYCIAGEQILIKSKLNAMNVNTILMFGFWTVL